MVLEDLIPTLERLLKEHNVKEAELFYSKEKAIEVRLEKDTVKTGKVSIDRGIGIRLVKDGKLGFSYTASLSPSSLKEAVKKAVNVALSKTFDPYFKGLPEEIDAVPVSGLYDASTTKVSVEEVGEKAATLLEEALRYKAKGLKSVFGAARVSIVEKEVYNSLSGTTISSTTTLSSLAIYVVAEKNGVQATSYSYDIKRAFGEVDPEKVASDACEDAVAQLVKAEARPGTVNLVLHPYALAALFSYTLLPGLLASQVQERLSPFARDRGNEVVPEFLSIIDDGTITRGVGSCSFDDEGQPSSETILIDKGILEDFLHNSYTAKREDRPSTGNGFRRSFRTEPRICPTNVLVESRSIVRDSALFEEVRNGIYCRNIIGAHTANVATGEFSVVLSGARLIENGELKGAVRGIMLGDNIKDFLRKIVYTGKAKTIAPLEMGGYLHSPLVVFEKAKVSA